MKETYRHEPGATLKLSEVMLKYKAKQKEAMLKLLVMNTTMNLKKFLMTMVSFIL